MGTSTGTNGETKSIFYSLSDFNDTVYGEFKPLWVEMFQPAYNWTLKEIRGIFSMGELGLMLDVMNGVWLLPGLIGQHLLADVADGIALDGMDEKWEIQKDGIINKLQGLTFFQMCVLELWCKRFWTSNAKDGKLQDYTQELTAQAT